MAVGVMGHIEESWHLIRSAADRADAGDPSAQSAVIGQAIRILLATVDDPEREGLIGTPGRFARAWQELTRGYDATAEDVLGADFDGEGYDELLLEVDIPFTSLCEHHLLPFTGVAHVGYITNGRVVGLSKLVRLVTEVYAPRLQMQERITVQVADAIVKHLNPKGAIVILDAAHSCVECRGVRVAGARTMTSAIRGAIAEKPEARAEALALINLARRPPA